MAGTLSLISLNNLVLDGLRSAPGSPEEACRMFLEALRDACEACSPPRDPDALPGFIKDVQAECQELSATLDDEDADISDLLALEEKCDELTEQVQELTETNRLLREELDDAG